MTGSFGEVRALLAAASESLGSAFEHAGAARRRLHDAVGVLAGLDALGQHREPLVPVELRRAEEELERGLGLIGLGVAAVADIDARI